VKPDKVVETQFEDVLGGGFVSLFAGVVETQFRIALHDGGAPRLAASREALLKYSTVRAEFMKQHGVVLEHLTAAKWATLISDLMTTRSTVEDLWH